MDYSSHHSHGRQKSRFSVRRFFFAVVFLMVASGAAFMIYEYKSHPAWADTFAEYHGRVNNWLTERKQRMHQGVVAVRKTVAARDDSERVVNFEFYSALQDTKSMQVEAEDAAARMMAEKAEAEEKYKMAIAKRNGKTVPQQLADKKQDSTADEKKAQPVKISHAAELENDLLTAMKKSGGEK
jgi:hypothetical protein